MDLRLQKRLLKWHEALEVLDAAELEFLLLNANEKSLWGELYLQSEGKNVEEKKSYTASLDDWRNFEKGLAISKSRFNSLKRRLELTIKSYEAEYQTYKREDDAIKRHP